ncbi:unnamed protein product [marine sediment metagenome]|uniref:DUF1499 domain-containing protein n=1 Tax=marine sediment metagenome TaxID=412755 RepID=X0VTX6_9ZZZZ
MSPPIRTRNASIRSSATIACAIALAACAGPVPTDLGVRDSRLAPCPASPNCVASDADDTEHAIAPLVFDGNADDAWRAAREATAALPRTQIVDEAPGYLRAESRSALFGFVDDLELQLRTDEGTIAVRSASRVGYSDLGVNRGRVEALRSLFGHGLE